MPVISREQGCGDHMDKETIGELIGIVGKGNVLTSEEERICYSYDATNQLYKP